MCDRSSMTLTRVLASLKTLSPAARKELRRRLNAAPEPPSLRDAIQQARAPKTNDRLRAALTPAPVRS